MDIRDVRKRLERTGLFDAGWYASTYADVALGPLSPFSDFMNFGILLRRDPGPFFSTTKYLAAHPEADAHPDGPFVHFLTTYPANHLRSDFAHDSGAAENDLVEVIQTEGSINVGLTEARIRDFKLHLTGWVLNTEKPRMAHRIGLRIAGSEFPAIVARQLVNGTAKDRGPLHAVTFEAVLKVPESLIHAPVELHVLGSDSRMVFRPRHGSAAAALPAHPPHPLLPNCQITGAVDRTTPHEIRGWALCDRHQSAEGVELLLKVNGTPLMVTRCTQHRKDLQQKYGGDGFFGFRFPLPDNLWAGEPLAYDILPTTGVNRIEAASGTVAPPAGVWVPVQTPPEQRPIMAGPAWEFRADLPPGQKISVIILNRNGQDVLRNMLVSAEITGDLAQAEWLVVDHQSTDGSKDICLAFQNKGFDIHFLPRNGNFSFSDSNNYALNRASGDLIIFANNDLVFLEPVLEAVRHNLQDSRIGILGVELLDDIEPVEWHSARPIQHAGVHIKTISERGYLRPFEARAGQSVAPALTVHPAVTAAFVAMRRADVEAIGGFDERYSYGLEDVDLCFKVARNLDKHAVLDPTIRLIHRHGFSRKTDASTALRSKTNNEVFNHTWGPWLHERIRAEVGTRPGYWAGRAPTVGFAVTNAVDAGDYFTARELGDALQEVAGYQVVYLERPDWHALGDIDVLINMTANFDLAAAKTINPFLISINWTRQFFDRWATSDAFFGYDHVLASSDLAARFLQKIWHRPVPTFPIASNVAKFQAGQRQEKYQCDYCFTGSYFAVGRDIQFDLDPPAIQGKGIVFGSNWQNTPLEPLSVGPVPYSEMPDIYASTRIVIDDAFFGTGPWASCNSRVFDALAAGCLVLTNNDKAAAELFDGLLPAYHDRQSLTDALNFWLTHEPQRQERVKTLQAMVVQKHDYHHRAQEMHALICGAQPLRIAIKCPAPLGHREQWGDTHFANSLAANLRRQGAVVRVDFKEHWDAPIGATDDVVITLRGLSSYTPHAHQINILWLISHPDAISVAEMDKFDHVFVASQPYAQELAGKLSVPVSFLPQCSDTDRFPFLADRLGTRADRALFIGNTRGVFRDAIRWTVEQELDVHIYGENWERFIKDSRLKGRFVPNEVLSELYSTSRVVLCDHWKDMARHGFLSNRAYDVLACGGLLLTDPVAGIETLLPEGSYLTFQNAEDLARHVKAPVTVDHAARAEFAAWVEKNHSFAARAREIMALIPSLRQKRQDRI